MMNKTNGWLAGMFELFYSIHFWRHVSVSGDTLLRDNRRLIGRSLIVLARQVQNNRN